MKKKIYILICISMFLITAYTILFYDNDNNSVEAISSNVIDNKEEIKEVIPSVSNKEVENTSVFFVEPSIVKDKLGDDNLNKLSYIVNTMPIIDVREITNISNSNESDDDKFRAINDILKKRLSSKDYNEFKVIMNKYVNFNIL